MSKNEKIFFNEVVPQFESIVNQLIKIINYPKWTKILKQYKMVCIEKPNKGDEEFDFYYTVTNTVTKHLYLYKEDALPYQNQHSVYMNTYDSNLKYLIDSVEHYSINEEIIKEIIRKIFIYNSLLVANIIHLKNYFKNILNLKEQIVKEEYKNDCYIITAEHYSYQNFPYVKFYEKIIFVPEEIDISNLNIKKYYKFTPGNSKNIVYTIVTKMPVDNINDTSTKYINIQDIMEYFNGDEHVFNPFDLEKIFNLKFKNLIKVFLFLEKKKLGYSENNMRLMIDILECENSNGYKFENLMEKFLKLIFEPYYGGFNNKLITQVSDSDGYNRKDYVIRNRVSNDDFLNMLKSKEDCVNLLFDAKNYANELNTNDLKPLINYIHENPKYGKVSFILSKNGASKRSKNYLIREMHKHKIKVIVLDENDLIMMLYYKSVGLSPLKIIEEKYEEMTDLY